MAQKKKRETLDEFLARASDFSQPPRENYVEDPEKAKAFEALKAKENAINEIKAAETKVSKKEDGTPQYEGGALTVFGVAPEAPEPPAPPAPPEAPAQIDNSERAPKVIPENLIPKDEPPVAAEEARTETKEKGSSFPWDRALVGATPLLVGLLTGNQLEGIQVAGDHLVRDEGDLTKRGRDLEQRLAELQAKRDVAASDTTGTRRYRPDTIKIQDPTAPGGVRNVIVRFDTFTGKHQWPNGEAIDDKIIEAGYSNNPEEWRERRAITDSYRRGFKETYDQGFIDPVTGERARARDGRVIPMEGQGSGTFTVKQEKDVEASLKEFRGSPVYKQSVPVLQLAPSVNAQLDAAIRDNDPNSIAGSGAVLRVARLLQGSGVITDQDAARLGGAQAVDETLKRIMDKFTMGRPVTHRDVADLREIVDLADKGARRKLEGYLNDKVPTLSKRYGIPQEAMREQLASDINVLTREREPLRADNAPTAITYKGVEYQAPNRTQSVPVELNGELLFIEPKHWPIAEKDGAKRLDQ